MAHGDSTRTGAAHPHPGAGHPHAAGGASSPLLADVPPVGWAIAALGTIRAAALGIAAILLGRLIDSLIPLSGPSASSSAPHGAGPAALAVLVAAVAAAAATAGEQTLTSSGLGPQEARWRSRLAAASLAAPVGPDAAAGESDGEIVTRATETAAKAASYRVAFLGPFLTVVAAPAALLVVAALGLDLLAAAALLVSALLVPCALVAAFRLLKGSGAAYGRASASLSRGYLDAVRGAESALVLDAVDQRAEDLRARAEAMRAAVMRLLARNQLLIVVTDAVFGLATTTAAALIAVWAVTGGALSLGGGVSFVLLARLMVDPVERLGRSFYVGLAGRGALAQIRAALRRAGTGPKAPSSLGGDAEPGPSTGESAPPARPRSHIVDSATGDALVRACGLGVTAGESEILSGVDIEIRPGEHVAVVGASGAGKSTLALALLGELAAAGTVATAEGARLAYVPQRTVLFTGTVAENVRLGATDADDAAVAGALSAVGLGDEFADRGGADLRIGEGAGALSGGQAQRLAIARALCAGADLLILDEATAHLDPASARRVREAASAAGCAQLEITHRIVEALDADRVVVLAGGRVVESGRPDALRSADGAFARMLAAEETA